MINATTESEPVYGAKPLRYYDDLVQKALEDGTAEYVDRSNVLRIPVSKPDSSNNSSDEYIYIGHILALVPETRNEKPYGIWRAFSAMLAVQDFNNRFNRFPDYPNLTKPGHSLSELMAQHGSNFYLTFSVRDSGQNFYISGKAWADAFYTSAETEPMPPPLAVVGAVASSNSAMVATLGAVTTTQGTNQSGVVTMSPASTASYLDNRISFPYLARTSLNMAPYVASSVMYYLESIGVRQFAILHVDSGLALDSLQQLLRTQASTYPLIRVFTVSFTEGNTESTRRAAELLKDRGMVYHYGLNLNEEMILQLFDAEMMGQDSNTTWLHSGAGVRSMINKEELNNENRRGDLHRALHRSLMISTWGNQEYRAATDKNANTLREQMRAFQIDSAAMDYLYTRHLGAGMVKANWTLYHDLARTTVHSDSSVRTGEYDAVLALGLAASQQLATNEFSTPSYYETIKRTQFTGSTTSISFNESTGTRSPENVASWFRSITRIEDADRNASILVRNVSLIVWKDNDVAGGFDSHLEMPIIYPDGTTTPPSSIPLPPAENMNLVSLGLRAFCWSNAGLVVLMSCFFALWTVRERNRPTLKASQPVFLFLLCVGGLLMGLSIIPATWQEPMPLVLLNAGCMAQVWLLSIGFSTTFAALFAKTWRITRLYNHAQMMRRTQILASQVVWVPTTVFIINCTILVAWTILSPLKWIRTELDVDEFDRVVSSEGTCTSTDSKSTIFWWLLILINLSSFCFSGVQSYRARKLPSAFHESFYITVSNFIILEAFLVGIPLLYALNVNNTSAFMVVECWVIAASALAVLLPMFIPKMDPKDESQTVSVVIGNRPTAASHQTSATALTTGRSCNTVSNKTSRASVALSSITMSYRSSRRTTGRFSTTSSYQRPER